MRDLVFRPGLILICLGSIGAVAAAEVDEEVLSAIMATPSEGEQRSWDADCKRVKEVAPPRADLPSAAERVSLKGCDSRKLYYGIEAAADPVQARKCALSYSSRDDLFTSEAILMMIYANGLGVKRDLSLALRYACGLEAIRGEKEERIERLKAMQSQVPVERFDICQDAIGSFTQAKCATLTQEKIASRRDAEMKKLTSKWGPLERKALEELRKVAAGYAEKRAAAETDLSGYGKASVQIEKEGDFLNEFLLKLETFEEGKLPQGGREELVRARSEMEDSLEKILKNEEFYHGTVEKDDIRETQKKWQEYRDAWVRFGSIRYPNVKRESWELWTTRERLGQLKALSNYNFEAGDSSDLE